MTLHYAPTTPEEEELALALALSASLSAGKNARAQPSAASGSAAPGQSAAGPSAQPQAPPPPQPTAPPPSSWLQPPPPPLSSGASSSYGAPNLMFPSVPPAQAHLRPPPPPRAAVPPVAADPFPRAHPPQPHAHNLPHLRPPTTQPQPHPQPQAPHGPSTSNPSTSSASGPGHTAPAGPSAARPVRWPPGATSAPVSPRAPAATGPAAHAGAPAQPTAPPHPAQPPPSRPAAPPLLPTIPRSKSASGPPGGGSASGQPGGAPAAPLFSNPDACAGCGRGFGLLGLTAVTGMGRKWHAGCFRCGFCAEPIHSGTGSFSYSFQPGDPRPYHADCYRHAHHPACAVCAQYIAPGPDGRITYRENGFWRERYCSAHEEAGLARCCACSRLQKHGQEWAPLPDGRPLCLRCLSDVVLDTADAQPLYDDVLAFYRDEMRLPHPSKPPLLLVDSATLNQHATAEGRDDSAGGPVFHIRGLCVAQVYSHIPTMRRGAGGTLSSVATALTGSAPRLGSGGGAVVRCHVQVLLLLYGLPRLLAGSIIAHELMHAWLRMAGVVGLELRVEEGLCQLMAALWVDRQHELLEGDAEQQRLASFFSYQIRTDTSEVYGDGFRDAMEAFQTHGLTAIIRNVQKYGRYTPP